MTIHYVHKKQKSQDHDPHGVKAFLKPPEEGSGNIRCRCYPQVGLGHKRQHFGISHGFHALSSSRNLSHFAFGNLTGQGHAEAEFEARAQL